MPEKILALLFFRTMKQFGTIRGARKATSVALSSATYALEQEAFGVLRTLASDPNLGRIFEPGSSAAEKMGGWREIGQKIVGNQRISAQMVLDAACLVFAHSVFDAALLECCKAAALASPADWEQYVKKRLFTMSALKEHSYESVLQIAIDTELRQLGRGSILKKVDRIFNLCSPERTLVTSPILTSGVHGFSRERLAEIDRMRNQIVHGEGPRQLENVDDDISYLEATTFRMISFVMARYDLRPGAAALHTAANEVFSLEGRQ